jgi:predicted ArsR family transcriptional regulator
MTATSVLSLELRTFLASRVRSIEALEALLLLRREQARAWTDRELATALGLEPALLRERLDELAREGFASVSPSAPRTYRYQSSEAAEEALVAQLASVYASQRVDVLVFMATSAMDRVRNSALHTFSEAFRLRGPKKDG